MVSNIRDGVDHLIETNPEETGVVTPTDQPKEELVLEEGEDSPHLVVPATIPSWEVTDPALAESTAS